MAKVEERNPDRQTGKMTAWTRANLAGCHLKSLPPRLNGAPHSLTVWSRNSLFPVCQRFLGRVASRTNRKESPHHQPRAEWNDYTKWENIRWTKRRNEESVRGEITGSDTTEKSNERMKIKWTTTKWNYIFGIAESNHFRISFSARLHWTQYNENECRMVSQKGCGYLLRRHCYDFLCLLRWQQTKMMMMTMMFLLQIDSIAILSMPVAWKLAQQKSNWQSLYFDRMLCFHHVESI